MRTGGFETSQRSGGSYQTVNPGDVFVALSLCVLCHQWMWRRGQFIFRRVKLSTAGGSGGTGWRAAPRTTGLLEDSMSCLYYLHLVAIPKLVLLFGWTSGERPSQQVVEIQAVDFRTSSECGSFRWWILVMSSSRCLDEVYVARDVMRGPIYFPAL